MLSKSLLTLSFVLCVVVVSGCSVSRSPLGENQNIDEPSVSGSTQQTVEKKPTVVELAKQEQQPAGTYKGMMPCETCYGVDTTVIIEDNDAYTLTAKYLANKTDEPTKIETFSGIVFWNTAGTGVTLAAGPYNRFAIQAGKLTLLNTAGTGNYSDEMSSEYTLNK